MSRPEHLPPDALVSYLCDDRAGYISPWCRGNSKLGPNVYSYSRLPGKIGGTCPGASPVCEMVCYAKRIVRNQPLWDLMRENSVVPFLRGTLPTEVKYVRLHVSGDFDCLGYVADWVRRVSTHPEVTFWGYTRSWRVPTLLPLLEELHVLPNMQLFASMDSGIPEDPPDGWRCAWLEEDPRACGVVCLEERSLHANCESCGYCYLGTGGDVIFKLH